MTNSELGWVIERGDSEPCAPEYWTGHFSWSKNHLKAVRFARKEDAHLVAEQERGLADGPEKPHRIAEHMWCDSRDIMDGRGRRDIMQNPRAQKGR